MWRSFDLLMSLMANVSLVIAIYNYEYDVEYIKYRDYDLHDLTLMEKIDYAMHDRVQAENKQF